MATVRLNIQWQESSSGYSQTETWIPSSVPNVSIFDANHNVIPWTASSNYYYQVNISSVPCKLIIRRWDSEYTEPRIYYYTLTESSSSVTVTLYEDTMRDKGEMYDTRLEILEANLGDICVYKLGNPKKGKFSINIKVDNWSTAGNQNVSVNGSLYSSYSGIVTTSDSSMWAVYSYPGASSDQSTYVGVPVVWEMVKTNYKTESGTNYVQKGNNASIWVIPQMGDDARTLQIIATDGAGNPLVMQSVYFDNVYDSDGIIVVPYNTTVQWSVSGYGSGGTNYDPSSGTITVTQDTVLNVPLGAAEYYFRFNPTPSNASVQVQPNYEWIDVANGTPVLSNSTILYYRAFADGYEDYAARYAYWDGVNPTDVNFSLTKQTTYYTVTFNPILPSQNDGNQITVNGTVINGSTYTAPENTIITWDASCEGYQPKSNTLTLISDTTQDASLNVKQCTFTIIPSPSDADVSINGQLRSSITVNYGTYIEWEVKKSGYGDQSDNFYITKDYSLPVSLDRNTHVIIFNIAANGDTTSENISLVVDSQSLTRTGYTTIGEITYAQFTYTAYEYDTIHWTANATHYESRKNVSHYVTNDTIITTNLDILDGYGGGKKKYVIDYTVYDASTNAVIPNAEVVSTLNSASQISSITNNLGNASVSGVQYKTIVDFSASRNDYNTSTGSVGTITGYTTKNIYLQKKKCILDVSIECPTNANCYINDVKRTTGRYTYDYGTILNWEVSTYGTQNYPVPYPKSGVIELTSDSSLIIYACSPNYTHTFYVTPGDSSEGIYMKVNNNNLTRVNNGGYATFTYTDLAGTKMNYQAWGDHYNTVTGMVQLTTNNSSTLINLPRKNYDLVFNVYDNNGQLISGTPTLQISYTDAGGNTPTTVNVNGQSGGFAHTYFPYKTMINNVCVDAEGYQYEWYNSSIYMTENRELSISLDPLMCTVQVIPTPSNADVSINGQTRSTKQATFPYNTSVYWEATKSGYDPVNGNFKITEDTSVYATLPPTGSKALTVHVFGNSDVPLTNVTRTLILDYKSSNPTTITMTSDTEFITNTPRDILVMVNADHYQQSVRYLDQFSTSQVLNISLTLQWYTVTFNINKQTFGGYNLYISKNGGDEILIGSGSGAAGTKTHVTSVPYNTVVSYYLQTGFTVIDRDDGLPFTVTGNVTKNLTISSSTPTPGGNVTWDWKVRGYDQPAGEYLNAEILIHNITTDTYVDVSQTASYTAAKGSEIEGTISHDGYVSEQIGGTMNYSKTFLVELRDEHNV